MKMAHIVFPLLISICASASAKDWYVSVDGDDSRNGSSPKTAFQTLQKANSAVAPGDVVLVGGGLYTDPPKGSRGDGSTLLSITASGTPDQWITWKAMPGQTPVLRTKTWAAIRIHASYVVVDGFTLIGYNDEIALIDALASAKKPGNDPYYNSNGIFIDGGKNPAESKPHHIIVRNCSVSKMPGGGLTGIQTDYVTFEDNKIFDNAWYMKYAGSGITFLNYWAFDDKPGYHVIVQRNLVWNNKTLVPWNTTGKLSDGNGILIDVSDPAKSGATNPNADAVVKPENATNPNADPVVTPVAAPVENKVAKPVRPLWNGRTLIANNVSAHNGGSGIHTFRTAHVDIINNTIFHNGTIVGYHELFSNRSDDIVMMNNIIVPRPGGKVTVKDKSTNVRWDYNMYPVDQNELKGDNDIVADPKFIDAYINLARANFRFAKDSPAIGKGTRELFQALDIEGKARTADKRPSLGAYK